MLDREAEVADGIAAQQVGRRNGASYPFCNGLSGRSHPQHIEALTLRLGAAERELADAHLRLTRQRAELSELHGGHEAQRAAAELRRYAWREPAYICLSIYLNKHTYI